MRLAIEGLRRGAPYGQNERFSLELWAGITNTAVNRNVFRATDFAAAAAITCEE
jgi:hypothetical protein